MIVTRFAPSPSGYLHLGHAYAALFAAAAGDKFLLRIEDIDAGRCMPAFTAAIIEDLHWLGLHWPEPVRQQSRHMADYQAALARLRAMGLVYPCFCTRRDVECEAEAAGAAPHAGPDGPVYSGACRVAPPRQREGMAPVWRLDMAKACAMAGPLVWHDREKGEITARPEDFGDVVLARRDVPTSYHLSVTVDDHLQGVTLVTRGADLFRATDIHRLLQSLLGYVPPDYHHHALRTDATGRRFAKRDKALTLRELRAAGHSPEEVKRMAMPEG